MPEEISTQTILVAQDGSQTAQSAAQVAIQIAQQQHLVIRGLYIIEEALVMNSYANYRKELGSEKEPASREELVQWFQAKGEVALQWLETRCREANVIVVADILFSNVVEAILRESTRARILALGRRGHKHGVNSDQLGENFRTIAQQTQLPILVGGTEQRTVHRLLLAYYGSKRARQAITWAALFQRILSATVEVLAVQENKTHCQEWLTELQEQLAQEGLTDFRFFSRQGQPATEIVTMAIEHQVDLLVMGGYRHTTLFEWLVGSTVDRVLRTTPLPVFVV